jgi:pyruvate ferredoxin oxidoreductase delta subunit
MKNEKKIIGGVLKGATSKEYKTGNWKYKKPVWDSKRCVQCMICYVYCPDNCILIKKDKDGRVKRSETDLEYCKGCGICEKVCPVKCIKMEDE